MGNSNGGGGGGGAIVRGTALAGGPPAYRWCVDAGRDRLLHDEVCEAGVPFAK